LLILLYIVNNYALLDTVTGVMKLWEPSGESEWLNECADVKWNIIGGLCLKEMLDTLGFVLLKNGLDTLAVRYVNKPLIDRKEILIPINNAIFSGNSIISNGWVYLMNNQGQVSENSLDFWVANLYTYYDLYGNVMADYNKFIQ